MIKKIIIAAMFIFMLTGNGLCAEKSGAFSISPMVGGYVFDNQQDIEKDAIGGLGLGYNFTQNWTGEAMFNYGRFDHEYFDMNLCCCPEDKVNGYAFHMDSLYHFQPDKNLVPYLAAGLGAVWVEGDHYEDDSYAMVNYGGGIKYYVTNNIAVRGDVRHIYSLENSDNNMSATLGFTFTFGGEEKIKPSAEPEKPVIYKTPEPENEPAEENIDEMASVDIDEFKPAPVKEKLAINLNIQFDLNKNNVRPIYHDRLKKIADFMHTYPQTHAVIEGHTCNIASEDYNLKLSQKRADSVRAYLIQNFGVESSRLQARGFGMSRPIADNSFEEGREINRRVIVVVSNGDAPESIEHSEEYDDQEEIIVKTLKSIKLAGSDGKMNLAIMSDSPILAFHSFQLDHPNRIVIDLPGKWKTLDKLKDKLKYDKSNHIVKKIRVGQHENKLRVVVDLKSAPLKTPEIKSFDRGLNINI